MKRSVIVLSIILAVISLQCSPRGEENKGTQIPRPKMEMQELENANFLYAEVTGSYEKHPALIDRLTKYIKEKEINGNNVTGIYPEDPDAVPADELDWDIGYEVPENLNGVDEEEFKLRTMKGGIALVVNSTVEYSATHGLYCKVWLLEHGYVQTQPTRMIYHLDHEDPMKQSTTIIFPVVKRSRDIPVITNSTTNHKVTM